MQNGKKGQHNVKTDKQATEQVQGGEGRQRKLHQPNFQTYKIINQGNNDGQGTTRNNKLQDQNSSNNSKLDKNSKSVSYTVVQLFAARLIYNQAKNEIPMVLNDPIHTTRQ